MTRTGWRQGPGELARNVVRVMVVYALALQVLAPLAAARAGTVDGSGGHLVVCSMMAGASAAQPATPPAQVVHDCLACCLGSIAAVLAAPVGMPGRVDFSLLTAPAVPKAFIRSSSAGRRPPQRAPPGAFA